MAIVVLERELAILRTERPPSPGGESKTNHQETRCRRSGARHGYMLFWVQG